MAFCPRCGYNNADTASFCGGCANVLTPTPTGASPPPLEPPPGPPPAYGAPSGYGNPYDPNMGMGGGMGGYGMPPMPVATRTSGMAIAGFVLAFFCSILGLIFSIIGYNETKNSNGTVTGGGLAVAGIIISIINMVLGLLIVASN